MKIYKTIKMKFNLENRQHSSVLQTNKKRKKQTLM